MKNCEQCAFYSLEYDEFRQEYADIDRGFQTHFCTAFASHIPAEIYENKRACPHMVRRDVLLED